MNKLNCSIGDLAITVKANLPANLGNIVRIIGSQGLQEWEGQDEPLYTWDVQIVGEDRYLHYDCDGEIVKVKEGPLLINTYADSHHPRVIKWTRSLIVSQSSKNSFWRMWKRRLTPNGTPIQRR